MNFIKDFIMDIGRKLKNLLSTLCVIALLLMLLTGLGTLVFKRGNVTSVETKSSQPVIVEDRELDREVKGAMGIAREAAYEYASTELDTWINEMMARADEDFLDDYFSFMQTKRRELTSLYNTERDNFNKYWEDINPFIKYGCLRDEKFYDRVKDILIYKTADDRYISLSEYLDTAKEKNHENEVYYATDPETQGQYISMFQSRGIEPVILPAVIDSAFISMVEAKNENVKFLRIDATISEILKNDDGIAGEEVIQKFKNAI